jgi:hypothetical protein
MFSESPFSSDPFGSFSVVVQAGFAERHYFTLFIQQGLDFTGSISQGLDKDFSIQQRQDNTLVLSKKVKS